VAARFDWRQSAAYGAGIVVVSLVACLGYGLRADLAAGSPAEIAIVFFGYLGALLASLQDLIRRYATSDLRPATYRSFLVRMLLRIVFAFGLASLSKILGLPAAGSSILQVAAFVVGLWPQNLVSPVRHWIARRAAGRSASARELPLEDLEGMNAWQAARLYEVGIDDVSDLATADLCRLLIDGQFNVTQLVDWVDQALLCLRAGTSLERFRRVGIRTLSDLRAAALNLNETQRAALASELGLPEAGLRALVGGEGDLPNYAHVASFHKLTAHDARRRGGQLLGPSARP
jgi:hypothetical protein